MSDRSPWNFPVYSFKLGGRKFALYTPNCGRIFPLHYLQCASIRYTREPRVGKICIKSVPFASNKTARASNDPVVSLIKSEKKVQNKSENYIHFQLLWAGWTIWLEFDHQRALNLCAVLIKLALAQPSYHDCTHVNMLQLGGVMGGFSAVKWFLI